jgi:hypothetical protein
VICLIFILKATFSSIYDISNVSLSFPYAISDLIHVISDENHGSVLGNVLGANELHRREVDGQRRVEEDLCTVDGSTLYYEYVVIVEVWLC